MCRDLEALLFAGIVAMVLTTACGPALPTAQAPTTPPPSEFVPGWRLQAGTVLHYRMRGSVTGTAAGQQTPEAYQEMRATYHVLSVDSHGTASVRIDLEGKPDTFARIRKNGTILEARALSPEATGRTEAWARAGGTVDRPVRVGDAIPFRQPLPQAAAERLGVGEFVGTVSLRGFSPIGRCWAAELQGAAPLDAPVGTVTAPKTGRQFHVTGVTADVRGRIEVQTGALVDAQVAVIVEIESPGASPRLRARLTITSETRLDPSSLGALGCGR